MEMEMKGSLPEFRFMFGFPQSTTLQRQFPDEPLRELGSGIFPRVMAGGMERSKGLEPWMIQDGKE